MKFPCILKNAFLVIRDCFGLSFASKGLGYLAAYLLLPSLLSRYKLSCYQTTRYLQLLHLQTLPYWKLIVISFCFSLGSTLLLKRAKIDPLYLWVIKAIFWRRFREWSAFGKWNLVRKHLYSVLKFIVTCYYGKQSFEGFVRGIFTTSKTIISHP